MSDPEFLLLGDAVWLDFVNSARGRDPFPPDLLPDIAAFGRWARLLSECDAGTCDGLEAEGEALRALFGGEGFARFAHQVRSYDFDGALHELRRAAGEQGIEA